MNARGENTGIPPTSERRCLPRETRAARGADASEIR